MALSRSSGNKKRSGAILYGVDPTQVLSSPSTWQGATAGGGFPPNKRYKSVDVGMAQKAEDLFGDNDDFTAADLEEIDIIASQALSQGQDSNTLPSTNVQKLEQDVTPSLMLNIIHQKSVNVRLWNDASSAEQNTKARLVGNGTEDILVKDAFQFEVLQTQHENLKEKLKEMQDEIIFKNGEIKVLRDSMQQLESTMEEQRRSNMLLEKEKTQTLNEKEREFSKKLQSLQSQLQFKDAEMNELRTKLQNCERIKSVASSVSTVSPRKSPSRIVKSEGGSPQSGKRSFPTKESFSAEMSGKPSCSTVNSLAQTVLRKEENKTPCLETAVMKQEATEKNISYTSVQRRSTQGSFLLNALMKQPVVPGSLLGLWPLLSRKAEALSGSVLQPNCLNRRSTGISGASTAYSQEETLSLSVLREAQKLATTGLNLMAMDEGSSEGNLAESEKGVFYLKCIKIPGAVHLLPLVEHYVDAYCQAVQVVDKTGNSPCRNQPICSSRTNTSVVSSTEDFRSTLEEITITSLGILYYLVFYSWDVVSTLLLPEVERKAQKLTGDLQDAANKNQFQHALFKKLLQVLAFSSTTTGSCAERIMNQSLKVLVKLAENSTIELLISFHRLLNSQTLLHCMCAETPLPTVYLTIRLLAVLVHHPRLAAQLCSHSETCLLLALYMYITSRPDKSASEMHWLQLEQEAVRFLTKCMRCSSPSVLLLDTDCQCSLEVVKALIVMLHRQWVKVRRSESNFHMYKEQIVQFLRDTVLLLHSLSQKDKRFQEHFLEVLHQYDQAIPGVRAILKKSQKLNVFEEMALDELYPPETEADAPEIEAS
ncbi:ATR-interacting protein [Alligator sinensis]|uniref:ATR-interacting protein n=1 Tax=Alligator sinensis TaxID=38654 RepID=A0A3Q0GWK2_ALLSI|nr:ATR-interacting protein [Alligator sinensis]